GTVCVVGKIRDLILQLSKSSIYSTKPQGWYRLASTYDLMGQLEKCIEPYLHSLSLNVDNDHAWFNLGGAFFNMGNYPEARRVWKEAVSRFPDHELTAKIRADIPFILTDEPLQ
ncbi:tetratricopeptide repeat protein, partial [Enterobacter soli]|uniref:tetratricopeptide repeat protein n=1 Tax=Enterobacter soli TaxID=885040 RepID=UPI003EDB3F93